MARAAAFDISNPEAVNASAPNRIHIFFELCDYPALALQPIRRIDEWTNGRIQTSPFLFNLSMIYRMQYENTKGSLSGFYPNDPRFTIHDSGETDTRRLWLYSPLPQT